MTKAEKILEILLKYAEEQNKEKAHRTISEAIEEVRRMDKAASEACDLKMSIRIVEEQNDKLRDEIKMLYAY